MILWNECMFIRYVGCTWYVMLKDACHKDVAKGRKSAYYLESEEQHSWRQCRYMSLEKKNCDWFCNLLSSNTSAAAKIFSNVKNGEKFRITSAGQTFKSLLNFCLNYNLFKAGHIMFPGFADEWNTPHSKERRKNVFSKGKRIIW